MQYDDLNCANVGIEKYRSIEKSKKCHSQYIFFNWIISVIYVPKFTQFGTLAVEGHLEGTVSHNFQLCTSFYFMKYRKSSFKN